ncbi:hypothetical protein DRO64_08605 [Candidatus Bathyarchaeota archaeon]|nr:MAG: hypothetical protein DRO64_08605 [Candidatus Bathyarchaeota archaeon]
MKYFRVHSLLNHQNAFRILKRFQPPTLTPQRLRLTPLLSLYASAGKFKGNPSIDRPLHLVLLKNPRYLSWAVRMMEAEYRLKTHMKTDPTEPKEN